MTGKIQDEDSRDRFTDASPCNPWQHLSWQRVLHESGQLIAKQNVTCVTQAGGRHRDAKGGVALK
jgi:hypothetical protein